MNKLILNEELFDDVLDIDVPEVDVSLSVDEVSDDVLETPTPGSDVGVSNMLIAAINDEWDTVAKYNDLIANLDNNTEMIPVIQDILAEENKHIGQLQQLLKQLSPNAQNIESGEVEADQQLGNDEVSI